MDISSAFFWWLVIGGVTGWFASLVVPTERQHLYADTFFGVLGALAASLMVEKVLPASVNHYALIITIVAAFVGACAVVALWRLVALQKKPARAVK